MPGPPPEPPELPSARDSYTCSVCRSIFVRAGVCRVVVNGEPGPWMCHACSQRPDIVRRNRLETGHDTNLMGSGSGTASAPPRRPPIQRRPPIASLLALAALGVDPRTACDFRAADGRRCMLDYGHKGEHGL